MTELPPDARRVDSIGPGTRLREWEVIRFVGRGAFGMVFEARRSSWVDADIRGSRALKVFDPVLSSAARSALVAEFATMREVRHPNLVAGDDAFDLEDGPFAGCVVFVMELCDTDLAAEAQRSNGVLGAADAALVVAEVADGLAALHDNGRIHGDVKPENILRQGSTWKLGDFGVSGVMQGSYALAPGVTIDYRPPEFSQADEGVRLHRSADIWALGVTLHVTCAGRHPFPGPDPFMRYAALLRGERQPAPNLDPRLGRLIDERCLNADPRQRATARELASELRGLASELAVPDVDLGPDVTRPVGPPTSAPPPAGPPKGQPATVPLSAYTATRPPTPAVAPFPTRPGYPEAAPVAHGGLDQTATTARDQASVRPPPGPSIRHALNGWALPVAAAVVTIAVALLIGQISALLPGSLAARRIGYLLASISVLGSLLYVTLRSLTPHPPWGAISILTLVATWVATTAVLFGAIG